MKQKIENFYTSVTENAEKRKQFLSSMLAFNDSLLCTSLSEEQKSYILQSWTLYIYAQCEGFIKNLCREYIGFLKQLDWDLCHKIFSPHLYWVAVSGKNILDDKKYFSPLVFFEDKNHFVKNEQSIYDTWLQLFINSNKMSEVSNHQLTFIKDWLFQIDFEIPSFIPEIKTQRNAIAHGDEQSISIDVDKCKDWNQQAYKLIDGLLNAIYKQKLKPHLGVKNLDGEALLNTHKVFTFP